MAELELRVPFTKFLARALGLLGVALFGWFLPGLFRYLLWLSVAGLLRLGFLEELRPVIYARGRLLRGGEARAVAEVAVLEGRVVAGLWPRFGVRFRDGALWWLPLGPNWYLLWDALREVRPELVDWRSTPLAAYFLVQARGERVRPEVPGELYEIAEEIEIPLGVRGLAYVAGILCYSLANVLFPSSSGPFSGAMNIFVGFLAGILAGALDHSIRLRAYARALTARWAEEGR